MYLKHITDEGLTLEVKGFGGKAGPAPQGGGIPGRAPPKSLLDPSQTRIVPPK